MQSINKIIIFCLLLLSTDAILGQAESRPDKGINEYVKFANESIHGMLIAHRLFENYNQDLNKYVDLPGHQLNFYNNNDLPADIFADPDHWFYETSPDELYRSTQQNKYSLNQNKFGQLQEIASEIRRTTLIANRLRLSIADSINELDLNDKEALYAVYEMLESASDAFDLLQAQVTILETQTNLLNEKREESNQFLDFTGILNDIHQHTRSLLSALKKEEKEILIKSLDALKKVNENFRLYKLKNERANNFAKYSLLKNKIIVNIGEIIASANTYLNQGPIPEEYALYGDSYYYYNTNIINKINRYGNGLTPAMNEIIDLLDLPIVHKIEVPHYLNIIYPEKVEKQVPVIRSTLTEVKEAPVTLENRAVVMSDKKHRILVDDANPTLEIFDHLKQDGDIISLNFNGDWIFENLSLERKPRKIILELNDKGKNFLILHAVNEGSVPPNTIGINYIHKGRKKRYIMQSNLRTSQMVEIKLDR